MDETPGPSDPDEAADLVGYSIHATDGEIGEVDEHEITTGMSYLVVRTRSSIFGKTVLLPATVIQRIDHEERAVYVACTKHEIKLAPKYRDDRDPTSHRDDILAYYSGSMLRGPPPRTAGSDHPTLPSG